ncbi:acyltransferase [Enterovibrio norvegicus]|uniref:Surface polysaccharide O-acyltransferase, integral membrane enzyme n=1 Tax=Enterovibrio norvegicus DSM 15893 TaxID=1121869 RepID=A0A1I5URV7_9GAMM|nr:acyltransferase [Enterovibrio norvegicus]SFP97985.1 Surface polysaccharide O-acyltransferase, integral membrane enzyme [Enterovibrio norvegicus DSM 15893]
MQKKIFYVELLRVVAAIAVIAIHVLGPYRHLLGQIPDSDWVSAVLINGASRWAVPVFIMITGALMLSDTRPFSASYFVRRRVMKVFVPFLVWSLFYGLLAAVSLDGVNWTETIARLATFPSQETYYHLGFFYYFLPLYVVIPLLRPAAQHQDPRYFNTLLGVWIALCTFRLAGLNLGIVEDLLLYGGYLLLGLALHRNDIPIKGLLFAGLLALIATEYTALSQSALQGKYTSAGWFSYKIINTVLIAAMVFGLCKHWAERISPKHQQRLVALSRQSLGIYLIHPIFLWPIREWGGTFDMAWLTIPLVTLVVFVLSYWTSRALSSSRWTAWLVP